MKNQDTTLEHMNAFTVPWQSDDGVAGLEGPALDTMADYAADPAQVAAFRRDGAVLVPGAFADWVAPLARGLERNLAAPEAYAFPCESTAAGEAGRFFDSYCNWQRIPEYRDFVARSPAAAMAGRFMGGASAQFFHEHVFLKEPGTQRATPWHQDLPYYCVDGARTASIYVALDPTPKEVAVSFVAGSHRWGKLFYPRVFLDGADFNQEDRALEPVPDIDANPGDYRLLAWDLAPGDAVLFDFRTLHGTSPAPVAARRSAFSTRWLGDDVVYCKRPGETSPPYPDIGLEGGQPMREDWFPVLWRRPER